MNPYVMAAMTLFQAIGQVQQGQQQKAALNADANFTVAQADARVALEKASASQEALDRARKLRQITGRMVTSAAGSGVALESGSIGSLINDSQGQYAREQDISAFNTDMKTRSISISAQSDAANMRAQGSNAARSGWMNALGTIGSFGMNAYDKGWFGGSGGTTAPSSVGWNKFTDAGWNAYLAGN